MRKLLLFLCAATVLPFLFNSASAQMPDDIRKHFDEHVVGQWTWETTWGDERIKGEATNSWDESGTCIRMIGTAVDSKGKSQISETQGWDSATGEIVVHGFDSRGSSYTVRWKRANGADTTRWVGKGSGTYDGKWWESATTMECGKDSLRYEDTTDGKPFVTIGKRKPKSTSDQTHLAWLKYLEGTWSCEEGPGNSGTVTFRAAGPAPALVFQVDLRDYAIAGVIGWHTDSKMFVEALYYADRKEVTGIMDREYAEITRDSIKGQGKYRLTNGLAGNQRMEYRRVNENEMTLTGTGGNDPDWVAKFKRVK